MKKAPIGTVACPVAGCGATCDVFKFAHTATRDTGRRKAGKLYFRCPTHGQLGFDGAAAMQEYLLEHMKFPDGEAPPPAEPKPAPHTPPGAASPALAKPAAAGQLPPPMPRPVARPAPPAEPPKKKGSWLDLLP